jgi:hypothetical protein
MLAEVKGGRKTPEVFHRVPATPSLVEVRSPCCGYLLYYGQVLCIIQRQCERCKKIVQVEPLNEGAG